jgi:hypothetical protein
MNAIARQLEEATDLNPWGTPDASILRAGRVVPPNFPKAIFGDLWGLIVDLANGASCAPDYVGVGLLAVAASMIGNKRRVRPFSTSHWEPPCILWAGLVGDASTNKTPGIRPILGVLKELEARYLEDLQSSWQQYETRAERAKMERKLWEKQVDEAAKAGDDTPPKPDAANDPEEPPRRRMNVRDVTPEVLGVILAANPMGTLHLSDELAGWFTSIDRYNSGGRPFWLEAYNGDEYAIDRKHHPTLRIPFNGVSILGGIQPERLNELFLSAPDDGLVSRFLWAWPDPIPFHRPHKLADLGRLKGALERLDSLEFGVTSENKPCSVVLPFTDGAADIFERWIGENDAAIRESAGVYKTFLGKGRGTVLTLSNIAEHLAWADGGALEPREISSKSIVDAIEFFETYAKPAAVRVLGDAALPPVERDAATIAKRIVRDKLTKINARDIYTRWAIPSLRLAQPVSDAIEQLVDADWLRPAPSRQGDTVGRAKKDFVVNPQVHEIANG